MITYKFKINTNEEWRHCAGARDSFRLFFVARGELKINIRQKTSRVKAGQAIIVAKNDRISAASSGDGGIELYEIGFQMERRIALDTKNVLIPEAPDAVRAMLVQLFAEGESIRVVENAIFDTVLSLVIVSDPFDEKQRAIVGFVEKYVDEHIAEPIEVDAIAEAMGYNRSHVSRVFSAATGKSIKAYISEKKVAYAVGLLEFSDFNVNTVAQMAGFGEPNLFTKFFSYHTGKTPSDYRRELRGVGASRQAKGE